MPLMNRSLDECTQLADEVQDLKMDFRHFFRRLFFTVL
jgi:hypothetical protein